MDDLTGEQLLDITMHMWLDNNIKCSPDNTDLIMRCLGLEEFKKRGHLRENSKVDLDASFLTQAAQENYRMVVKPHSFFSNNNIRPFHGMVLVHREKRILYCTEESVNFLMNNIYKLNLEIRQLETEEPTYIIGLKS